MSKGSGRRPTDPAHALRCDVDGHAMPDIHGRCFRCGARWWPPSTHVMVPDPEYVPPEPLREIARAAAKLPGGRVGVYRDGKMVGIYEPHEIDPSVEGPEYVPQQTEET